MNNTIKTTNTLSTAQTNESSHKVHNELVSVLAAKVTNYANIASIHVNHSMKNRPYDNILFKHMVNSMWYIASKEILEYGCGHGHYANCLAQSWAKNIIGIDVDKEAINALPNSNYFVWDNTWSILSSLLSNRFDVIYSMYVFETINDIWTIKNIFQNIYNALKSWGIFMFLIGNVGEFYGKGCVEFSFPINPLYPTLKNWDPYIARLLWDNTFFDVQDFYFSIETYKDILAQVWFKVDSIQVTKFKMKWDEYDGMIDEKDFAPSMVISVIK
jgi:SAM-dependent methyltransferase